MGYPDQAIIRINERKIALRDKKNRKRINGKFNKIGSADHHAMKMYGRVEVLLHAFSYLSQEGELLALWPSRLNSPEINPVSTGKEDGWAPRIGLNALHRKFLAPVKKRNSIPQPQSCSVVTILTELSRLQRILSIYRSTCRKAATYTQDSTKKE
jgi:hypothetical protein